MNYYKEFSKWLDNHLEQMPSNIVAINFNIYEGSDEEYQIQLIGVKNFNELDEDWACEEDFSTGEDMFFIKRVKEIEYWEDGLSFIIEMINEYILSGKYSILLKELEAVGIGFVDGDIEFIIKKH